MTTIVSSIKYDNMGEFIDKNSKLIVKVSAKYVFSNDSELITQKGKDHEIIWSYFSADNELMSCTITSTPHKICVYILDKKMGNIKIIDCPIAEIYVCFKVV
jgi:hypothetical protein